MSESLEKQRLDRAMAAVVKLERQLDAAKVRLSRLSGSYDLCRLPP